MKKINLKFDEIIKRVHKLRLSYPAYPNWHFFVERNDGRRIVSFYVFRRSVGIVPFIMKYFSKTDFKEFGNSDDLDYVLIIHYEIV